MKRLCLAMLLLLMALARPAHAQLACSQLTQQQLLNSFSDNAPAGSITPRNLRDLVCSSGIIPVGTSVGLVSGAPTSGDGAVFLTSGSNITLQDASQRSVAFPAGVTLSRSIVKPGTATFPPLPSDTGIYEVLNPLSGSATGTGAAWLNLIQANESGSNGISVPSGSVGVLGVNEISGGSGMVGGRVVVDSKFDLNATSGSLSGQTNYAAGRFSSFASANDNGTSVNSPFASGHSALFGGNMVATLLSGATNWNGVAGLELDLSVDTGATVIDKTGLLVNLLPDDAVAASRYALGVAVGSSANPPAAGFDIGYAIGSGSGFDAVAATGSLFACAKHNQSTACAAHAYGINLLDFGNFTTAAFASNGFLVDGSGNVTGAGYKVGATAGASCPSGVTAGTVVVVGGIITHC